MENDSDSRALLLQWLEQEDLRGIFLLTQNSTRAYYDVYQDMNIITCILLSKTVITSRKHIDVPVK